MRPGIRTTRSRGTLRVCFDSDVRSGVRFDRRMFGASHSHTLFVIAFAHSDLARTEMELEQLSCGSHIAKLPNLVACQETRLACQNGLPEADASVASGEPSPWELESTRAQQVWGSRASMWVTTRMALCLVKGCHEFSLRDFGNVDHNVGHVVHVTKPLWG